jgi:hypothetical protein
VCRHCGDVRFRIFTGATSLREIKLRLGKEAAFAIFCYGAPRRKKKPLKLMTPLRSRE